MHSLVVSLCNRQKCLSFVVTPKTILLPLMKISIPGKHLRATAKNLTNRPHLTLAVLSILLAKSATSFASIGTSSSSTIDANDDEDGDDFLSHESTLWMAESRSSACSSSVDATANLNLKRRKSEIVQIHPVCIWIRLHT